MFTLPVAIGILIADGGRILYQNGNGNFFSNNYGDVPSNTWAHIVYVYDQSQGKEYIYVDTAEKGQKNRTGNIAQNSNVLRIGWGYGNNTAYTFSGLIDDVRIYNRALTQAEITELYNLVGG